MFPTILNSIKQLLGIHPDVDAFDDSLRMNINTVFMILNDLGVGPEKAFVMTTGEETWVDFTDDADLAEQVKTYIYLKVRLIFDPPSTSFVIDAINKNIQELEWRLNVRAEAGDSSGRLPNALRNTWHEMGCP